MSVIEVKNLSFAYGEGTNVKEKAVDDVTISFEKGDFVGIIGHTGSGKSTFIKHLNGLLKPDSGSVTLNGTNIWYDRKKIRDVRFKVGMVFQYPEHQLFADTVFKDIAFGPENMGLTTEEVEEKVLLACDFVGLNPEILNKSPFEISGGEKRRAAIAGVIAMTPEVLVLDEPTAGLDPQGRDSLLAQIKNYHNFSKNTVIMVSHSMDDVAKVADRVAVMSNGEMTMYGETKKVFQRREELEKLGLSLPQVTSIMLRLKDMGFNVNTEILTVESAEKEILSLLSRRERLVYD